jgi:hypothetical protein
MNNYQELWATYFPQFIKNSDKGVQYLEPAQ